MYTIIKTSPEGLAKTIIVRPRRHHDLPRAGRALRDALAKDEHNTALRIDFDGPPADDAPPPVESPLT